jgi:ferrochelatase
MSRTGVLLIQLGTPDAPTAPAVRRYLRGFLSDPRVIEAPRLPWWLILNGLILRVRPAQSAAKYQRIWDPVTGSPLLHYTRLQTEALRPLFPGAEVRSAMQVGNPSLSAVLGEMLGQGIDRLIVMPMYPQYSAPTTASALDALFKALMKQRRLPALRVVPPYYDDPRYIDALAGVIEAQLKALAREPEHYLISFHGLPLAYVERGDPYAEQVQITTKLLVDRLGWPSGRWTQSFQSRFGRAQWLQPYTDQTLMKLARSGVRRVFVLMPGFTADCLETIDEIGREGKDAFHAAGGELLHRCPCLNDHPDWIRAMREIIEEEGRNWL